MIHTLPNAAATPNAAMCQSHMLRLTDFYALLLHRASVSAGSERKMLLAQANKVHQDIEGCGGDTLTKLEQLKRHIHND